MAQGAIDCLFHSLGEEPEETLTAYLITLLQDNSPDSLELAELQEVVAGFSVAFDELGEARQLALLQDFVRLPVSDQIREVSHMWRHSKQGMTPPVRPYNPRSQCAAVLPSAELNTQIGPLQDLYPDLSTNFLGHVLHDICHDELEDAAHWLMDQQDVNKSEQHWHLCQEQRVQEAAEAVRREKASRKQLLDKYHLQVVNTATSMPSCRQQQAPKSKNQVRYRDGQVVTAKGEKYVVEKIGQDWDGGSKGKVFTKGKRGKGTI